MATLNFKGKPLVWNHHLSVPYHQLVPRKDKSQTDRVRLDDNLIIHGDNLKALKALLPVYARRIKCIYIDPPYNTGNEWVYNDAVNSPMIREWLGKEVSADDLTRHDKWLCMMTPRLKLMKELLSDDGVIFISADDNEIHNLKSLMDEIFQGRFVGQLIWRKKEGGGQTDEYFVTEHEYILAYANGESFQWLDEVVPVEKADFKHKDERGEYARVRLAKWGSAARREDRPKMYFSLESPDKKKVYPKAPDGGDGRWRVGEARMEVLLNDDRIHWEKKEGQWIPYEKKYYSEGDVKTIKERSILYDLATTADGSKLLIDIFGKKDVFENPKPYQLVRFLIEHTTVPGDVVLDAFAGSGTTGHAVLSLNLEDEGKRRFVLIEEQDYADSITAERLRRVLKGVPSAKSDASLKKPIPGSFSYFDLGDALEIDDLLKGKKLPSREEMARYVFHVATGSEFKAEKLVKKEAFIGSDGARDVFLIYEPDIEFLRTAALTLDIARALKSKPGRRKIVFAPTKYLDQEQLDEFGIDFAQLPYDLYKSLR